MPLDDDVGAFVQRFSVDFSSIVVEDEEESAPNVSVGSAFSCVVRVSIGPPRIIADKPTKRGVRVDSWIGMTTEPDAEKYEGTILDEGNEIILAKGDTAIIKLPHVEDENNCAFPGMALFFDWTNVLNSKTSTLHVIGLIKVPFYMLRLSGINAQSYSSRMCGCYDCSSDARKLKLPDHVPKTPPVPPPPPLATPRLAIEERSSAAKRARSS